ncbi:MAG: hypothetical protein K2X03_09595 [Bryobacteraceae bacterium]|nr:hypothetical protein [Bryobacteraceae bacterium]
MCLLLLLSLTAILHASEPLSVRIHNQARLPAAAIAAAITEARWVLSQAGVETTWCDADPCRSDFSIGIRQDDPRDSQTFVLGFAMLGTAKGNTACVVYPRVLQLTEFHAGAAPLSTVLGYVMAHELAHMLMRSHAHSAGVMSASWTVADLRAMSQRHLRFSPAEASALQYAATKRRN